MEVRFLAFQNDDKSWHITGISHVENFTLGNTEACPQSLQLWSQSCTKGNSKRLEVFNFSIVEYHNEGNRVVGYTDAGLNI